MLYLKRFITFLKVLFFIWHQTDAKIINSIRKTNGCNLFEGKWVYDDSYPLYATKTCPFIEKGFDCVQNGRPDQSYLKYRWQPSSCKLPRFDGVDFLERYRGKKIMFVGDSLSLNQWQSLTCMLHNAVPRANFSLVRIGDVSKFSFPAYNVKILFSRNAFLVDIVGTSDGRVLKLDSISSGKSWMGYDTLIFNTWHWWLHTGRKQPWDIIEEGKKRYNDMDRLVAYEKALTTWAKWVDSNVDPSETKVFFQGVSPDHNVLSEDGRLKTCVGQSQPMSEKTYHGKAHPAEIVVERVLHAMSNQVYLLNVTMLSQLRSDGHPSFFGHGGHNNMDCSHWCLAGVPDIWNELLYATLRRT